MIISALNPYSFNIRATSSSTMSAAEVRQTDKDFAALFADETPESTLKKITEDGLQGMMKWKVDQLRKQIAEKSLASRGLSLDDIAALPPEQRVQIEKQILDEVAQKLKQAISEQMKKETGNGLGFFESPADTLAQKFDLLA